MIESKEGKIISENDDKVFKKEMREVCEEDMFSECKA